MRGKRSRASSDASPQQPVKKLIKASGESSRNKVNKMTIAGSSTSKFNFDENEEISDPARDVTTFQKTCQSIQTLFENIKSMKDEGAEPSVSLHKFLNAML